MIRAVLACVLVVGSFALSAPAAGSCIITGSRLPIDNAQRCSQHQTRIHAALAVAEVEVGDFSLSSSPDDPDLDIGVAPIRVIRVISGKLKQNSYAYPVISDMGDGVVCPYSNVPTRGRQIAYFQADKPTLDDRDVEFQSQDAFDQNAGACNRL